MKVGDKVRYIGNPIDLSDYVIRTNTVATIVYIDESTTRLRYSYHVKNPAKLYEVYAIEFWTYIDRIGPLKKQVRNIPGVRS